MPLLLFGSYVFYATWSIPFVLVILLTTSIDYLCSKTISNSASQMVRKVFLWLAILLNLAILGYFKYFNFFLESQHSLLHYFGITSALPKHLDIILPLGISYYTFEAISYVVDVYRGKQKVPSWLEYNFYIMYFPHLIAGPIIRFSELFPQFQQGIDRPSLDRIARGLELIVFGYLFKVVIAGGAAVIADPFFERPYLAGVFQSYVACTAFIVELYFDFLGYTQIARGVSLLFNLELPHNFDHPGNATSIANFWHRWQISLSRWLHDYVFLPLGGARKSLVKTMANVFITLLIAGIWHGAGLNFIFLGLYYGTLVAMYHGMRRLRKRYLPRFDDYLKSSRAYYFVSVGVTFWFLILGGVFFRAHEPLKLVIVFQKLLLSAGSLPSEIYEICSSGHAGIIGIFFLLLTCAMSGPVMVRVYEGLIYRTPYWLKAHAFTGLLVLCWVMSGSEHKPFIYFQF